MQVFGVRLGSSFAKSLQGHGSQGVHGHFCETTSSLKCIDEAYNDIDASILLEYVINLLED